MRRPFFVLLVASALAAGCVYDPPPPYPVVVSSPPSFDRSWAAAIAAAEDAGIQVTVADRLNGNITGTTGDVHVTIELRQLSDMSVQVKFVAPGSKESNPTLGDRWLNAYNRRMGR